MKFISKNSKYTNRLIGHFLKFIQSFNLFDKEDELLVAVSGGVDSVALLWVIKIIQSYGYSNEVRVVHINHGTRSGQHDEENFVLDLCRHLEIECEVIAVQDLDPKSNFEYKARLKRYEGFYEIARPNEKIVLAHHIDDSFEWTMLQSLRSASIEGLVGIPVKNRRVIRPFMCLTKEQVLKFSKYFDLPYIEDPTNEMIKYERNFIRQNVIPAFSDRYKKYLKHYVYRHNEIARRLGLHLLDKNKSSFNLVKGRGSVLIFSIDGMQDYSGLEELAIQGLQYLNPDSRGSVSLQLKKLSQALKNHKYGPIVLTNSIKAYLDYHCVLITRNAAPKLRFKWNTPQVFSYDEYCNFLEEFLRNKMNQSSFPFFVTIYNGNLDKRNFKTSFNVQAVHELQEMNVTYYSALKLKREWSKKRNRHKALRINLFLEL